MKRLSLAITLIGLLLSCQPISLKEDKENVVAAFPPGTNRALEGTAGSRHDFENGAVASTVNIHYTGQYCDECHKQTPVAGGDKYLKYEGAYEYLCRCHVGTSAARIHPVDLIPSPAKADRITSQFPLQDGKMTCRTCHDIYLQCQKRLFGKNSLRGAPYERRTDFCYQCHEVKNYQRLNPHDQISDAGEVLIDKCLFCHAERPDETHATFGEVKFIGSIEALCSRCHSIAGNHAGNHDHMAERPSAEGLRRLEAMKKKYDIILPLTEDGKMTCMTCHNPHAEGVIPSDRPGAKGAGSEYRHRLPGKLCMECHQM